MKKIRINLNKYIDQNVEIPIRQTFYKDSDLRLIYALIYIHQPIAITELTRELNKLKHSNVNKGNIWQKIEKITNFGIIECKAVSDCKEDGSTMDLAILKKHEEWLKEQRNNFKNRFEVKKYYYLTNDGLEWVAKVDEIQTRFKNGGF